MNAFHSKLQDNLLAVQEKIRFAAQQSGANQTVCLIAVSKTQPHSVVEAAFEAGQCDFGENYIQEGVDKIAALSHHRAELVWHMIGPIQSNKTRLVAEQFDWVHTIDRLKTAQRLSEQRPSGLAPLQCLVQVNIDSEASKSGVAPSEVSDLLATVGALPNLQLRGLMCIPHANNRLAFAQMKALFDALNAGGHTLDVLSMGMSADFEQAIACGSTHVRVGSAIFGARAA